jgi:hypothetical protein
MHPFRRVLAAAIDKAKECWPTAHLQEFGNWMMPAILVFVTLTAQLGWVIKAVLLLAVAMAAVVVVDGLMAVAAAAARRRRLSR